MVFLFPESDLLPTEMKEMSDDYFSKECMYGLKSSNRHTRMQGAACKSSLKNVNSSYNFFDVSALFIQLIPTITSFSVVLMNDQVEQLMKDVKAQSHQLMALRNESDQKWIEISGKHVPVSSLNNDYLLSAK